MTATAMKCRPRGARRRRSASVGRRACAQARSAGAVAGCRAAWTGVLRVLAVDPVSLKLFAACSTGGPRGNCIRRVRIARAAGALAAAPPSAYSLIASTALDLHGQSMDAMAPGR